MGKIRTVLAKEVREALPPFIFFLLLFHMIALTKTVLLKEFSITALREVGATLGALVVAKAILIVEALPISRWFSRRLAVNLLWKILLYSIVVFVFRTLEEAIQLFREHGDLAASFKGAICDVSWPVTLVLQLWIVGGLVLYCFSSELVHEIGPAKVKEMLFRKRDEV